MSEEPKRIYVSAFYLRQLANVLEEAGVPEASFVSFGDWLNEMKVYLHKMATAGGMRTDDRFPSFRDLLKEETRLVSKGLASGRE